MIILAIVIILLIVIGKFWLAREDKKNGIVRSSSGDIITSEKKDDFKYDGGHNKNDLQDIDDSRVQENIALEDSSSRKSGGFKGSNPYSKSVK